MFINSSQFSTYCSEIGGNLRTFTRICVYKEIQKFQCINFVNNLFKFMSCINALLMFFSPWPLCSVCSCLWKKMIRLFELNFRISILNMKICNDIGNICIMVKVIYKYHWYYYCCVENFWTRNWVKGWRYRISNQMSSCQWNLTSVMTR